MSRNIGADLRRAFSAAVVLAAVHDPAAHADCQIGQVAEITVETGHTLPLAHAQINGQPVRVLIDTGSVTSMVWRPAVERLGLRATTGPRTQLYGLGGESRVDATIVKDLRFGSFAVKDLRVPVAGDLPMGFDLLLRAGRRLRTASDTHDGPPAGRQSGGTLG